MSSNKKKTKKERAEEDGDECTAWDCTVCTYKNRSEAFKCEMCDTRKGTSTRKSRLTQEVQQMQSAVHQHVLLQHQKLPGVSHKRKHQLSGGSPSNSRNSPESTSSGSLPKAGASTTVKSVRKIRPVPLADALVSRTSPKKFTITVEGRSALIIEYRAAKPGKEDKK